MMRILSVVDSFKGTLSSEEISEMIKNHFTHQNHEVKTVSISDGGEGFIEAIKSSIDAKLITMKTKGPLGHMIDATYLVSKDKAFIELNQSSGLTKIKEHELNPFKTSTYGLGLMIKDAIEKQHVKHIIMGIGGSSTNDGGAGMLQALGLKFYNDGREIKQEMNGENIKLIDSIDDDELRKSIKDISFLIASDVDNPLLGEHGCSYVYAPQKGASQDMTKILDEHMCRYANQVENYVGQSYRAVPGSGAAGGVGFAALSFLNAKITRGVEFVMKHLNVEKLIKEADVVIVGEGRIDHQTMRGKAPLGIATLAKKFHKKVIAICAINESEQHESYIDEIYAIVPEYANKIESLKNPKGSLKKLLENMRIES